MSTSLDIPTLTAEFERTKGALKSYIVRITANKQEAEDITQETYIRAHRNVQNFKGDSSVKTWLFAIASNLAKDHLRARRRWPPDAMDLAREASMKHPEVHITDFLHVHANSPQGAFELREHIHFCFTCIGRSLPIEQQMAILLKEILELKVSEIASILETTEGVVKHWLFNGRRTMQDIFEQRCSLINKNGACHQCAELTGLFNPKQVFHQEHMKTGLENEANDKSKEALFDLRLRIAKAIDPLGCSGTDLHQLHFEHIDQVLHAREADPGD